MQSELDICKLSYEKCARGLGDYQILTKNELANGYCDADENNEEVKRSEYFSALMLRYWFKIFKWKEDSSSLHLQDSDFVDWLVDCLNDALYYRSWRKIRHDHEAEKANHYTEKIWIDNPQYVDDANAADKSINYFCAAKRGKEYQLYNKQKRKSNVQTYSLDAQQEDLGDSALDNAGAVYEPDYNDGASQLINLYLTNNKGIEALILDAIAKQDVFKETKIKHVDEDVDEDTGEVIQEVYFTYSSDFDERKLVKHLNQINQKFMKDYFEKEYFITSEQGDNILTKLKSLNNTKLYKYIKKTFIEIRTNPQLLSYILK